MTRARCGRGALGRLRALNLRATRSRARRGLTLGLVALTAIHNDRLRLGNRGLENIVTQIRDRRALRLQHILAQVWHGRARRNCALEHILAHIR